MDGHGQLSFPDGSEMTHAVLSTAGFQMDSRRRRILAKRRSALDPNDMAAGLDATVSKVDRDAVTPEPKMDKKADDGPPLFHSKSLSYRLFPGNYTECEVNWRALFSTWRTVDGVLPATEGPFIMKNFLGSGLVAELCKNNTGSGVYEPYAVEETARFEVCECQCCVNEVLKARTRH